MSLIDMGINRFVDVFYFKIEVNTIVGHVKLIKFIVLHFSLVCNQPFSKQLIASLL